MFISMKTMEIITTEFVSQVLSDLNYSVNKNGLFQIVLKIETDDIDWMKVLAEGDLPIPAFYLNLDEIKTLRHKIWAENLAYNTITSCFRNENKIDDLIEHFISLAMALSEAVINTDEILHESIMVNIGVDTGDSCNDYTANTVPPAYGADHSLKESEWCASIVWLTKQQGHKKGELYFALDHIKYNPELIHTKLMESIANEVWSTLSIFTHLFFFVKMSVYDLLLLNTLLKWRHKTGKWGGYILINKEATTGFYSPDVGSSSATDIKLEKEVKLPVKYISEILPDSAYKYPMSEIFDYTSLWDNGRVTYMSLPKHFRMCMEDYGFSPLKKNVRQNIDSI